MSSHFLIRKRKPESRAFPKLGLHSYLAFKLLDDVLRNGQSQSGTLLERIQLHKPVEYILHIFGWYTGTGICHEKTDMSVSRFFIPEQDASVAGKFHGIADKVVQNLCHSAPVGIQKKDRAEMSLHV